MAMTERKRGLGFKLETVEGTAETIAAADMILCEDIKFSPDSETLPRRSHLTTYSKEQPVAGRSKGSISFKVLEYGGSAAGTAPFWGALLQACGFSETVVSSTSVTYKPASAALKTATVKAFMDGISYRIKGARGTVSSEKIAGNVPVLSFTFEGLFEPVTDVGAYTDEATLVGSAFPAFKPKSFRAALLMIGGSYKAISEKVAWDIGNKLIYVPNANITDFLRVDFDGSEPRDPKGSIDAEAVTKATYDFMAKLANKTAVQIECFTGSDDAGSGTGTASTMTDTTKAWLTNQWASYKLRDSAGAVFPIASNTATVLTVTGTPATGNYCIYEAGKLVYNKMPKCVFDGMSDSGKNGIFNFDLSFGIYFNAGDDEIEIVCT